ncbi:MAG: hypothetical protein ACI94Y_002192 [Maribacter sp.]|jgi:hypothetical protein
MIKHQILFCLAIIILSIAGCIPPSDSDEEDILLAKVYNKPLYLSEMDGMIPSFNTPDDSTLIVNAFVDRWVRDNLMLYEAERNVPKDLNIDELVRDYRASLIIHNYEKKIAESGLDSIISDDEVMEYYNSYKTHFESDNSAKRCKFMKLPKKAENMKKAEKWWTSDDEKDLDALANYCKENAVIYQLEDSIWITNEELEKEFPKSVLSSLKKGKNLEKTEGDFKYYIQVLETQSKNSEPPLGYVRNRATNFILHNRKLEIVEKKKEELYQKAERKGHVKYYN